MNKTFIVIGIALLLVSAISQKVSPCPIQSNIGSLISGTTSIKHSPYHCRSTAKSCNTCARYRYAML